MSAKKIIRITTVPQSLKILLKGQHRHMTDHGFDVLGVSSAGQDLEEVTQNEGIRTQTIEMTRTIAPLKDFKALWQFYKLCKKERPTIVHSHTPKAGIIGMLGAKLAGVPIRLHTVAGLPLLESTGNKRELLDFVEKITYSSATKIYPNSFGLKEIILQEQFCEPEKLKVIGEGSSNGIDVAHFSPEQVSTNQQEALKTKLGLQENNFVFIFVGRLVRDKGVNELIRAFSQIQRENVRLLMLGKFEEELDPLEEGTRHEIENNPAIVYAGYQNDVRSYFAIADALVFPSYREGFPNVVMQAGAMGLPSIVTNINGCNEIVVEGKNGTIVPPKSTEAIQTAMEKMGQDTAWRNELASNARKMIVDRYQQHMVWEALLKEYEALIKEHQNTSDL